MSVAHTTSGAPTPPIPSEARIARALAHPLRARILQRLGERVTSPGELAEELGEPLGVVSYHVRMLSQYECIELVRTEPRRGALQHFYRATARPAFDPEQITALPEGLMRELTGATMQSILSDFTAALEWNQFPVADAMRAVIEVDDRAEKKLQRLLERTVAQVYEIGQEAAARESEKRPYEVGVIRFERAPS